ncbi:DUF1848 domain-containing protein [bacterium 210820-DFI.6.37]|nr:DUF1848 domain-containing protein [bacterium 210820-DFI.6.37]
MNLYIQKIEIDWEDISEDSYQVTEAFINRIAETEEKGQGEKMFINASGRTDIAAHYSKWFMERIRDGFVYCRNPLFPDKVLKYKLDPEVVDCILFCTKNPEPMLEYLPELRKRGFSVFFYVTITSYGSDLEPGVPEYHQVMRTFRNLSQQLGRQSVCWRYDPILITSKYTAEHHLRCFEEMAKELSLWTETCVFSFVQIYKKLAYTFPELRAIRPRDKETLLKGMGEISGQYGLKLQSCGDSQDYSAYGIGPSGCITASIMEKATGKDLEPLAVRPAREGCGCIHTNDIGAYDTCPNGCRYCYAVRDHRAALQNYRNHDPKEPLLCGKLLSDDVISEPVQRSFALKGVQLSMKF